MTYIGIDLGTSGIRALLVDEAGALIGSAEAAYPTHFARSGWSEQDPADWVTALNTVMARLRSTHAAFADLRGIGVAGHMHGAVLLGDDGRPLRPCIMWNDTRAGAEAAELDAKPMFRARTGNIIFPGFSAPKVEWVRRHEPEVHQRIAKLLLPAAFLNFYLSGAFAGDASDAAGTGHFDNGARIWDSELLSETGLTLAQMPNILAGTAAAASLRPELAREWGLSGEVVIAGGAGDNAAAACGIGAIDEGSGFVSLGTSGVVLTAREAYLPAPDTALHTFCHAVPERWIQMSVMLSATDSLNWLSGVMATTAPALIAEVGETPAGPGDTLFLPYLNGERTPHNDAAVRGGFLGLSRGAGRRELTQAVLEGVAYGLRDGLEAIRATGASPPALFAIGGGARSDLWVSLLATVLNVRLLRPRGGEFGAALGAARLALSAATDRPPSAIMNPPEDWDSFAPVRDLVQAYDDGYARFRAAYPAIKSI